MAWEEKADYWEKREGGWFKIKFVYNPLENGSPIEKWSFNKVEYEHPVGKILQYEDSVGEALLETYGFLQDLSSEKAIKLKEELENKKPFACKYCNFSSNAEIALKGHMRTHKDLIEKETKIDPEIIPLAEGKEQNPFTPASPMQKPTTPLQSRQIIDETQGSAFYGPGFSEKHGQ